MSWLLRMILVMMKMMRMRMKRCTMMMTTRRNRRSEDRRSGNRWHMGCRKGWQLMRFRGIVVTVRMGNMPKNVDGPNCHLTDQ